MKLNNTTVLLGGFGEIKYGKQYSLGNRVYDSGAIAMAHCANPVGNVGGYTYLYLTNNNDGGINNLGSDNKYSIRKLTPRECFRLMGLTSEDCDRAAALGVSNSQLYKQAGNGIITNCVELLFEHLYKAQYDSDYTTYDENFTQADGV